MSDAAVSPHIQAKAKKTHLQELVDALKARKATAFKHALREVRRVDPENPHATHLEGLFALQMEDDIERAHTLVSEAFEMLPESPAVAHNLATIKITLGAFGHAERLLLMAIRRQPDYAEAFHTLSGIRKFKDGDTVIDLMEGLVTSKKFNAEDGSFISFALAKAYDDVGRYDDAWKVLGQGNALMSENYDPALYDAGLAAIEETYTAATIAEKANYGYPAKAPIFIVGMPRSGTTLLETILGQNPLTRNAGELPAIPSLSRKMSARYGDGKRRIGFAETILKCPEDHLFRWGEAYMNFAQERIGKWSEYFTDKLPDNSFNLGLIAILLPKAKFIHIQRDPMDIALSIYFQRFTNLNYGFKLETIVQHYKNYQRVMTHWRSVLPKERLIELRYEDLVDDKDGAFDHIHAALNISRHDAKLASAAEGTKAVSTASRWQARQPVYTTSKQKWKRYEAQMMNSPLAELLDL
ncbi:MAG: sulfotransferase [Pseudomonadota bacterium]